MDLDDTTIEVIASAENIAVVGCSPKDYRPSNSVARYLREQRYHVIPVNPKHDTILGVPAYPDLLEAREREGPIKIVNIFRAPKNVPPHVDEAIEIGTDLIWMQEGVVHEKAALKAREAGITVVMDRCLAVAHKELKRNNLL